MLGNAQAESTHEYAVQSRGARCTNELSIVSAIEQSRIVYAPPVQVNPFRYSFGSVAVLVVLNSELLIMIYHNHVARNPEPPKTLSQLQ
jgi:hypothetical protein